MLDAVAVGVVVCVLVVLAVGDVVRVPEDEALRLGLQLESQLFPSGP